MRARTSKISAVSLAALLFAPILPVAEAGHTADPPVVKAIEKDEACYHTRLGGLGQDALGDAIERSGANDVELFPSEGSPLVHTPHETGLPPFVKLCPDGGLDAGTQTFVDRANAVIRDLNTLIGFLSNTTKIQRSAVERDPEMKIPVFFDDLQGKRVGGHKGWSVIPIAGEKSPFHRRTVSETFTGVHGGIHFTDPKTGLYPHATEAALVSPEIDLGSLRGNPQVIGAPRSYLNLQMSTLAALGDDLARCRLVFDFPGTHPRGSGQPGPCMLLPENQGNPPLLLPQDQGVLYQGLTQTLLPLYRAQAEILVNEWERQSVALLRVRHRFSLADGVDGVRVELYDRPPTSDDILLGRGSILKPNPPSFADNGTEFPSTAVTPNFPDARDLTRDPETGEPAEIGLVDNPLGEDGGFQYRRNVSVFGGGSAFSGATNFTWVNSTFDLSRFVNRSVWVVFHVKTSSQFGNDDFFKDRRIFPDRREFGWFLDEFNVTGDAYPFNLKVASIGNPSIRLGDEITFVPPGSGMDLNATIVNVGMYPANFSWWFRVEPLGAGAPKASETAKRSVFGLLPGHTVTVSADFGHHAAEGKRYRISANVEAIAGANPPNPGRAFSDPQRASAKNLTENLTGPAVFTPNFESPHLLDDNRVTIEAVAREVRRVEAVATEEGVGNPLLIAPLVAPKDEPRTVSVTLRNTGNTYEDLMIRPTLATISGGGVGAELFTEKDARVAGRMSPGDVRAFNWTIRPTLPGVYNLTLHFQTAGRDVEEIGSVSRLLYVQRTGGLVCYDNLADARACSPSWETTRPQALFGADVRDVWLSPTGEAYAALATGALGVRDARGVWTRVELDAELPGLKLLRVAGDPDGERVWLLAEDGNLYEYLPKLRALEPSQYRDPALLTDTIGGAKVARLRDLVVVSADEAYAFGTRGLVLALNASETPRHWDNVSLASLPRDVARTSFNAATLFPDGQVVAVGTRGGILRLNASVWSWGNVTSESDPARRTLLAVDSRLRYDAQRDSRHLEAWAVGASGAVVRFTPSTGWDAVRNFTSANLATVVATHKGSVWAFAEDATPWVCSPCETIQTAWSLDVATTPALLAGGARHARVFPGAASATETILGIEGGALHSFGARSIHGNSGRYDPNFGLNPDDGLAWVASLSKDPKGIRDVVPESSGLRGVASFSPATQLSSQLSRGAGLGNVTLANAGGAAPAGPASYRNVEVHVRHYLSRADPAHPPLVRLLLTTYPEWSFVEGIEVIDPDSEVGRILPNGAHTRVLCGGSIGVDAVALAVGSSGDVREQYDQATRNTLAPVLSLVSPLTGDVDGSRYPCSLAARNLNAFNFAHEGNQWQEEVFDVTHQFNDFLASAGGQNVAAGWVALEFLSREGSMWAIDNVSLVADGETILRWSGESPAIGVWGPAATSPLPVFGPWPKQFERLETMLGNDCPPEVVVPPGFQKNVSRLVNPRYDDARDVCDDPTVALVRNVVYGNHFKNVANMIPGSLGIPPPVAGVPDPVDTLNRAVPSGIPRRNLNDVVAEINATAWALVQKQRDVRGEFERTVGPAKGTLGDVPGALRSAYRTLDEKVWYGVDEPGKAKQYGLVTLYNYLNTLLNVVMPASSYWYLSRTPFRLTDDTLWHVNLLTDKPVWSASAEASATRSVPNQRDNRLLTPVIDLTQSSKPVLEFEHSYLLRAVRAKSILANVDCVSIADFARVEVQWREDDGSWSNFVKLTPQGGYPGQGSNGFPGDLNECSRISTDPDAGNPDMREFRYGEGWWGSRAIANIRGEAVALLDTSTYEKVRIALDSQPGLPPLSGKHVRFAFHVTTYPHPKGIRSVLDEMTTPYSGWYVKDLKVLSAERLGSDLVVENPRLLVGYDWEKIGVGPGTSIPVNVTIRNAGQFDALGLKAYFQVVRVNDPATNNVTATFTDPLTGAPRPVELRYDANLPPGKSVNLTFTWPVCDVLPAPCGDATDVAASIPSEGKAYAVLLAAAPLGVDEEDPTNNVASIGDLFTPVVARAHRRVEVEAGAEPRAASADVTRFLPVYVSNLGNMPMKGLELRRYVNESRGVAGVSTVLDASWKTTRVLKEGTRVPLSALADSFDVRRDLLWTPGNRTNYFLTVLLNAPDGQRVSHDLLVEAYSTYLFDDFEGAPRGEAFRGIWQRSGEGWRNAAGAGFNSRTAFAFGDPASSRYPNGEDAVSVSPTIDLSGASTAFLSFFHNYTFESGFDGARVEAQLAGSTEWIPLVPDVDPSVGYPGGYPGVVSATSPLDDDGDPTTPTRAFTGSTRDLPPAREGWLLSRFNLGQIPALIERSQFQGFDMQAFGGAGERFANETWVDGEGERFPHSLFIHPTWTVGRRDEFRYWSVENVTRVLPGDVDGDGLFLWSGSFNRTDDDLSPNVSTSTAEGASRKAVNPSMVVLVPIADVDPSAGERVMIDWWEWSWKTNFHDVSFPPDRYPTLGPLFMVAQGIDRKYGMRHVNVTTPDPVEQRGMWIHYQSDITDEVVNSAKAAGETQVQVRFVYARGIPGEKRSSQDGDPDPGVALDAIQAFKFQRVGGRIVNPRSLVHVVEENHNDSSVVFYEKCDVWNHRDEDHPCLTAANRTRVTLGTDGAKLGQIWTLTDALPDRRSNWHVASAADTGAGIIPDRRGETRTATGTATYWYSGAAANGIDRREGKLQGTTEERLVTPALDLSRIGGTSATLEFWHRFLFPKWKWGKTSLDDQEGPLGGFADAGAVEIQVYDKAHGGWGPWKQLYLKPPRSDNWGGYPSRLLFEALDGTSRVMKAEMPFERHRDLQLKRTFAYVFSGDSKDLPGATNSWIQSRFDLSEYIGQTVRIGFHQFTFAKRDVEYTAKPSGWWIDDLEIFGNMIVGKQIKIRLRAATDGDVGEGSWAVDDLAAYGSSYRRVVGVFLDPASTGGLPGDSLTFTGTLRNLGNGVRRDLAVQVQDVTGGTGIPLEVHAQAKVGRAERDSDDANPAARVAGVNLGPGGSAPVSFQVRIPREASIGPRTLEFRVLEYNAAVGRHLPITDNEIQGFLRRTLTIDVEDQAKLAHRGVRVLPDTPAVGQPTRVEIDLENTGVMPLTLSGTCTITRILHHEPVHLGRNGTGETKPVTEPGPACRVASTGARLAPDAKGTLSYSFVPTKPGYLNISLNFEGKPTRGDSYVSPHPVFTRALVGKRAVYWNDSAESAIDALNFTGGDRSDERAKEGRWSWRLGLSDGFYAGGVDYKAAPTVWRMVTAPINLHNVTEDPPVLSFWHLPRFALGDGADVRVRVLMREEAPQLESSWTEDCKVEPRGGYPGRVLSYHTQWAPEPQGGGDGGGQAVNHNPINRTSPDYNWDFVFRHDLEPGNVWYTFRTGIYRSDDFENFTKPVDAKNGSLAGKTVTTSVPPGGYFSGWASDWVYSEFQLDWDSQGRIRCVEEPEAIHAGFNETNVAKYEPNPSAHLTVRGRTIQFLFRVATGEADDRPPEGPEEVHSSSQHGQQGIVPDPFLRGRGQGWYVDALYVSGYGGEVAPRHQLFRVVDNTTKEYAVAIRNPAAFDDTYRITVDPRASSAPPEAYEILTPTLQVPPGGTKIARVKVALPRDPGLLPLLYQIRLISQSLGNPNVQQDAILKLDFDPRRWSDLRLTGEAPKARIQEGEGVYLPFFIENHGLVGAPATRLVVTDTWRGKTAPVDCKEPGVPYAIVPPIPSFLEDPEESTLVVDCFWKPPAGQPGEHVLRATVDPDGLVEQYTRADDSVTLKVQVTELLVPDLAVDTTSLTVVNGAGARVFPASQGDLTRFELVEGDIVSIRLAVRNEGTIGATNVDVRAFLGSLTLPAKTIPLVPPGAEYSTTFNWLAQKGEWPLQFAVRTDLVEIDDSNNRVPQRGLVLLRVRGFDVKAGLDGPTEALEPGTTVSLNLTLSNTGSGGEDVLLRATAPQGWSVELPRKSLFLREGETYAAPVKVAIPALAEAGEHLIRVEAVSRQNPMKASAGALPVHVRAVYGATLSPEKVSVKPGAFEILLDVENTGNSREPMTLALDLPGGWTSPVAFPANKSIAPHAKELVRIPVESPTASPPGTYDVPVSLKTPDGAKLEGVAKVQMEARRTVSLKLGSETPLEGAGLSYPLVAESTGNVRATFRILPTSVPDGWTVEVRPPGATLAPGESAAFTVLAHAPANVTGGSYPVTLYAHFDGVQPAGLEGRLNERKVTLKVLKPDLGVTDLAFSPRLGLKEGTRVSVKAVVENHGNAPARNVPVSLFVDDVLVDPTVLRHLEPGDRTEVQLNWTAIGGAHTLLVVLDPLAETTDASRDNNAASRAIEVSGTARSVGGIPAGKFDTPAGSVWLALGAIFVVALLGGRRRRT